MSKESGKKFNNFTLLELSHLRMDDLFNFLLIDGEWIPKSVKRNALEQIQKRIEEGKKIIDGEIQKGMLEKGDIIMVESPDGCTKRVFQRYYRNTYYAGFWKIMKHHLNFYRYIRKHAERKGIVIVSLEPGTMISRSGRLWRAWVRHEEHPQEKSDRIVFLATLRRNISMQRRIQAMAEKKHFLQPKMVVVASGHAVYLEYKMKPARVIFTKPVLRNQHYREQLHDHYLRHHREAVARHKVQKTERIEKHRKKI